VPAAKPLRRAAARAAHARTNRSSAAGGKAKPARRVGAAARRGAASPDGRSAGRKTLSVRKTQRARKAPARAPVRRGAGTKPVRAPAAGAQSGAGRSGNGSAAAKGYHLPAHLIVKPDITRHPWEHRRDYLILVAAIAASDAKLHPDELKLLESWIESLNLNEPARAEVLRVAHQGEVNLVEIARRLAGTPLTWSVMLDMMGMAMADGVLMDDEILLLRGLASVLRIDPVDFNILIEFVHSAHQAAQLSNPEPLYEHAIDSAYQLFLKRRIKLFEHTRLCVNYPEYDRKLKERWVRFEAAGHA